MVCLVRAYDDFMGNIELAPTLNNLWVCEYSAGQYAKTRMQDDLPDVFSDYRPPKIYTYNITSGALTEKTAQITSTEAQGLLQNTFGLRSAASFGNLVFLAGPMALGDGINMFVFNAQSGELVGAQNLPGYQNIRKWLVVDGVLYAAVANQDWTGSVLRWTGSEASPFSFDEVGRLDSDGAEITIHNGRIIVGTWPRQENGVPTLAGIWMSPFVPEGGLTKAQADSWVKVWQADEYEPDPLNAATYGVGPMASYGGYLFWGTMHVMGRTAPTFIKTYNIQREDYLKTFLKTRRATALFRGINFEGEKRIELLYGDPLLTVYVPSDVPGGSGSWVYKKNNMGGKRGKYGLSGFGNKFNNYTWTMAIYKNQLFVGTMDYSYLVLDWNNLQQENFPVNIPFSPRKDQYGADLWRFPSPDSAAVLVSRNGLGNYTNYGFRSVVVDEDTGMYLGTANPANIAQDGHGNPIGGWELIRVYLP